tara:strand:- start:46 stop:717 length:672 start_codon:yes stop_codon:yes gene_type:complete
MGKNVMKKSISQFILNFSPKLFLYLKFNQLRRRKSDINEHLDVLAAHAEECTTVFETGVRGVVSSWALIYGLNRGVSGSKKFLMNDIVECDTSQLINLSKKINLETKFIKKNNLDIVIDDNFRFDLLFIDTFHVYGQLIKELQKFSPYINKYIILHDTTIDGEHGEAIRHNWNIKEMSDKTGISEEEITVGLWPAIEEFIQDNPEWKIKKRYENNNGLTILTK